MSLYEITAFSLNHDGPVRNLSLMPSKLLKYDEQEVYNTTAKFAYEEARTDHGDVHFRCLHNNKYLVRHKTFDWIVAEGQEPVEDTNRRDCTLFHVHRESNTRVSWIHVSTGRTVAIVPPSDPADRFYLTIRTSGVTKVECTPIDVERIIKLPKTVLFKGDNDRYLGQGNQRSFFGTDRYRKDLWYETFPVNNGDVRFRSVQNGRFLRRDSNEFIVADSSDPSSANSDTVFQIVRLVDKTIAFINRGNNKFCQRMPLTNDRFKAEIDSGVKESQLSVEEPIIQRTIEVVYRLDEARIYGEQPRSWLSQVAFNGAREGDLTTTLSLSYEESMSFTYHATNTVTTNLTSLTTIEAKVLFVTASQSLEYSYGTEKVSGFEDTVDKKETYDFSCTVVVPPGQKRRARVMALEAKCDVPFSYVQTDVTATGEIIKTELQDGVYKGMNGYEFHVQVYDPDEPTQLIFDEPIATRFLPDTFAREKIYMKKKN